MLGRTNYALSNLATRISRYYATFRIALHCHYSFFLRPPPSCAASVSPSNPPPPPPPIPCGFCSPVPIAAAFASLLFAFSPLVWLYSIQAEVFALNNAFVAVRCLTPYRTTAPPFQFLHPGAFIVCRHILGASQRIHRHLGRLFHWPWSHQPAHSRVLRRATHRLGHVPTAFAHASNSASQNVMCWRDWSIAVCVFANRVATHAFDNLG